ncbi:Beta-mannosyltransferase 1 [Lithohypha guttulata]|uniref:Beta-mannosyltransferase 1 n=1 Tax=Lithohypha guttulata TaxID=1690604 RepID=UPI002DE028B1|nr:Beta-mannosyltransferase 1 [Lithohypha guttulata]
MLRAPRSLRTVILLSISSCALLIGSWTGLFNIKSTIYYSSVALGSHFSKNILYETLDVPGFANYRIPDGPDCGSLHTSSTLEVTPSLHIEDDILDLAASVEHSMVDYSGQPKGQSFANMVHKTWAQMSGSSVWLQKYGVYLTVTRAYFFDKGVQSWPVISFIRAQLHDANWQRLVNYTITWQGEELTFPRMLNIDIPHKAGGAFFGPEDPRIVIESGVEDAEPVVIFNMMDDLKSLRRSMHIHRPFSNYTTRLQLGNHAPHLAEKNWAPFFLPQSEFPPSPRHAGHEQYPNKYVHFVYEFHPLRIVRCHLFSGDCTLAYEQPLSIPYLADHKYNDTGGVMRGGTNFEPLPASIQTRPGVFTFVGIPRTHSGAGCSGGAFYRPEIMLLTTNGTHYYFDYASVALTFGSALFTQSQAGAPCEGGRIFMANSISRIHNDQYGPNKDVMEVTFSIADNTVQTTKIKGLQALVKTLPQFRMAIDGSHWQESDMQWNINVTSDIIHCSTGSAAEHARLVLHLDEKEMEKEKGKQEENMKELMKQMDKEEEEEKQKEKEKGKGKEKEVTSSQAPVARNLG